VKPRRSTGPDWAAIARRAIAEGFGDSHPSSASDVTTSDTTAGETVPELGGQVDVYGARDLELVVTLERFLTALGAEASIDIGLRGFPATLTVDLTTLDSPSDQQLARRLLRAHEHLVEPLRGTRPPSQSVRLAAHQALRTDRPAHRRG